MKLCDLHTHSTFSDGSLTPTKIINEAVETGLSAIALSDHNTVEGLPEFLSAASSTLVEAIPGAEFSVDYEGRELHLLGLFIPEKYFSQVSERMTEVNLGKEQSNLDMISALRKDGIYIDYDKIKASTPKGKANRAHIAAELTRLGYAKSVGHAFETFLAPSNGYYKEPKRITVWEMLDFIDSIHAVSVLAHPFLNVSEKELADFLPPAKKAGLRGMECLYSAYDDETTRKSMELATSFGLKFSGGSDFHGDIRPDVKIGVGKGDMEIPYEWALQLKK